MKKDLAYFTEKASELHFETNILIDGKLIQSSSGKEFSSINPADNEIITSIQKGTIEDIRTAVNIAKKRFGQGVWSKSPPRERMEVMFKWAELIGDNAESFALLDTLEMGKPISEMLNIDIPGSILNIKYMAECIDKIDGATTNTRENTLHCIVRQPLGVVGCITPWNYPLMMASWKVAPALAAGNSVVLKPATYSSLSSILIGKLFLEAGGPDGVFNVVPGSGSELGRELATNMNINKIAFTGSTDVGKLIYKYAGESNLKKVNAELGGKSPHIIFNDVNDLDKAVEVCAHMIYENQGEVCSAGSRIIVHENIYKRFSEKFKKYTIRTFIPGNPLDPETKIGPTVSKEQQESVLDYIRIGKEEGANLFFGGDVPKGLERGCFVEPTLFTDVKNQMRISQEEIFGPVGVVIKFSTVGEAIKIANDTPYGLAAGLWTSSLNTAHNVANSIESGMVWVNGYMNGDMTMPWGGWKESGQGRDKSFEAVVSNTQTKSIWINYN